MYLDHVPGAADRYNSRIVSAAAGIKRIYIGLLGLRALASRELADWNRLDAALATRLRAWRLGFLTSSYIAYELHGKEPRRYVSDACHLFRTHSFNGRMRMFLDNKLAFTWMLQRMGFSDHVPAVLALLTSGHICNINAEPPLADVASLLDSLDAGEKVVVKPVMGQRGLGLMVIERTTGGFLLNREERSRSEVVELLMRQALSIAVPYVEQDSYARGIFPHTTNTVRLLTMRDRDGVFAAAAVHRFGTQRSIPADNFSRGGLSCSVDLETGILGPGVRINPKGVAEEHGKHPDSDAQIEGVAIPRWQETLRGVLHLAEAVPFLRYVGWDIVVTPRGWVILEGNARTDVDVFQIHGPLLQSERVKAFFESRGVPGSDSGSSA